MTEHGHWLRTDTPGSLRYLALLEGGEEHSAIWNHVPAMVRDGRQNAFMRHFGRMAFDHARATPNGYGAVFGRAMTGFSISQSTLVVEALEDCGIARIGTWCDVAGGHGHLMASLLRAWPHLSGIVFDLPEVVIEEDALWAPKMEVADRCRYDAGDMFADVPCADA